MLTEDGLFHHGCTYNEEYFFDGEGAGDLPVDFAVASAGPAIAGLAGGVSIVDRAGKRQRVGQSNEWSGSGEHAPNATAAA